MTAAYAQTTPRLTALAERECFELLRVAIAGRIGFAATNGVQIIPVNFRLGSGPRLLFKTAPHGILAALAGSERDVAFEVDYNASDSWFAWSVLMQGQISQLDDAGRAAYERLKVPLDPPGVERSHILQFIPREITGRVVNRP